MLRVPRPVEAKARAAGAEWWLEGLSDLVHSLADEWTLSICEPYEDASEAFVTAVELTDGTGSQAVLKVVLPQAQDGPRREIATLEMAAGDGCVRLLRADVGRGALLLERLGASLATSGLDSMSRQAILVDLARSVWRPAAGADLPTGADQARHLVDFIEHRWEELDRPCSERAMAYARACAEERASCHDDERAVLVHGDVHQWNALRSGGGGGDGGSPGEEGGVGGRVGGGGVGDRVGGGGVGDRVGGGGVGGRVGGGGVGDRVGGYKLVDPDGLLAEPECDLGVIMREDPVELEGDGHDRSRWLAQRTGLDEHAIWQWGAAERVSTGLLLVQIGLEPIGRQMLAAAERVTPLRE